MIFLHQVSGIDSIIRKFARSFIPCQSLSASETRYFHLRHSATCAASSMEQRSGPAFFLIGHINKLPVLIEAHCRWFGHGLLILFGSVFLNHFPSPSATTSVGIISNE